MKCHAGNAGKVTADVDVTGFIQFWYLLCVHAVRRQNEMLLGQLLAKRRNDDYTNIITDCHQMSLVQRLHQIKICFFMCASREVW